MRLTPHDPAHGTANGYTNHGCRCPACREAHRIDWTARAHRTGRHAPRDTYAATVKAVADARDNHGTETRYKRCRCDACREAARVARARRRSKAAA